MQFFPQIRKTGLVFFCVAVRFFAPAQPHQFQFFPIKGLAPQQQGFVGKLGSHFFLLNEETPGRLGLYIYDTATQTGTNREYAFPKLPMSVLFFERSVLFISATPDKAGMAWHFLELNEEGKLLRKKEGILSGFKEPLRLLSSSDKKQVLFYQFMKKSGDSSFIRGSLIAADGEVKKQLAYFSPIQFLGHAQYGSLYLNTETGEGGLMLIRSK